jgi:hypothetical protein
VWHEEKCLFFAFVRFPPNPGAWSLCVHLWLLSCELIKDLDFPGLFLNAFGFIRATRMVSPRIWVQAKARQACVGVQMRRDVCAHTCCPRYNESFCVLLASPCALQQPCSRCSVRAAPMQLTSAVLLQWPSVRAMVKQGGSETAENDGSKLVNVLHP